MDRINSLEKKYSKMMIAFTIMLFLWGAGGLTIAIDYYGAEERIDSAEILDKRFVQATTIPIVDTCLENPDPDCNYRPGHSKTIYALVGYSRRQVDIYPVPKSYFYTVQEKEHIPVHKKEGFITGILYENNILYSMKQE